ncbi:hypothetical protein SpCBS45565_g03275 [Spizellomyces sp. 'palustris']|nr:hypothetical protein SpCBS45565_g03275 [Spizellomyces sp. 'palustris']
MGGSILYDLARNPVVDGLFARRSKDRFFTNTLFRSGLYAVFAVLIWLSILMQATSLITAAITLTLTCVFYLISVFKKEELERSGVTGGQGVATAAAGRV